MADSPQVDRFAAQRKALSTMLARFTADRDSLITAIQECQEQLAAIASRIDSGGEATDQLGEVKHLVERMRQDQEQIETARERFVEVGAMLAQLESDRDTHAAALTLYEAQLADLLRRVDSLHVGALQLDELRQSVDEIRAEREQLQASLHETVRQVTEPLALGLERLEGAAAAPHPANEEIVAATANQRQVVERLASEQQVVSSALDVTQQQLSELAQRVRDLLLSAEQADDGLQHKFEELQGERRQAEAELQASLSQALARTTDTLARLEQLESRYVGFSQGSEATTARIASVQDSFAAALVACQEQLAGLRGRFDATLAGDVGSLADINGRLDTLCAEQRLLETQARDEIERVQHGTNEALARAEENAAAGLGRLGRLEDVTAQVLAQQETLAVQIEQTRQHLANLAAESRAGFEREAPQVEALHQQLAAQQAEQRRIADELRGAVGQAMEYAAEAARRLDGFSSQLSGRLSVMEGAVDERFTEERQGLGQGLADCHTQLVNLNGRIDSIQSATQPQLTELQERVGQLSTLHGELELIMRGSVEAAVTHTDQALVELRGVIEQQSQRLTQAMDNRSEIERRQLQLDEILQSTRQQIAELAQQLEGLPSAQGAELEALRQHVGALHEEQQVAAGRTDAAVAAAVVAAQSAVEQVEALVAAGLSGGDEVAAALVDAAAERQQLHATTQEIQLRLSDLANLFEANRGPAPAALDELRSALEAIRQGQFESEVQTRALIERAGVQSASALQQVEGAAAARLRSEADAEALAKLLAEQEGELHAALGQCRQRIATLESAASAANDANTSAATLVEEIQQLQARLEGHRQEARAELGQVASQADDVVRRLSALEEQLGTHESDTQARRQFETQIAHSLEECRRQLVALDAKLNGQVDGGRTLIREIQQLVEAEQQETRQAVNAVRSTAESAIEKTSRLDEAVATLRHDVNEERGRSETFAATEQRLDAQAKEAFSRLNEEGAALRAALEEVRQQFHSGRQQHDAADHALRGDLGELATRMAATGQRVDSLQSAQASAEQGTHELAQRLLVEEQLRATAIQQCQRQIAELVQRLESPAVEGGPGLMELRAELDTLQRQVEETQKHAGSALDEAQSRLIDLAQRVHDATTAQSETLLALHDQIDAVRSDQGALRQTIAEAQTRVPAAAVQQAVEQANAGLAELHRVVEQVQSERLKSEHEIRGLAEAARSRADTALGAVEMLRPVTDALQAKTHQHSDELRALALLTPQLSDVSLRIDALQESTAQRNAEVAERLAAEEQLRAAAVAACERQLAELAQHLDSNQTQDDPHSQELRAQLQRLEEQFAQTQKQAGGALDEAQGRLIALAQRVHDATTAQSETLLALHNQIDAVRVDQGALRQTLTEAQEKIQAVERDGTAEQADARLVQLHGAVEQVEIGHRAVLAETRASAAQLHAVTQQTAARTDEALRAVESLDASQHLLAGEIDRQAVHADSEHSAMRVGLQELRHQVTERAQELERTGGATRRSVEQLRQGVEQMQSDRLQAEQQIRAATEAAQARADTSLRAVEKLRPVTEALEQQVEEASATAAGAQTQAETAMRALGALADGLRREVEEVRGEVKAVESRADTTALRQVVDVLRPQTDKLQQQIDQASVIAAGAQTQAETAVRTLGALADGLRQEVEDVRAEVKSVESRTDATAQQVVDTLRPQTDKLHQRVEEIRAAAAAAQARADAACEVAEKLGPTTASLEDELERIRSVAAGARSRADHAVQAVEALRPTTEGLQQQVDDLALVQSQADHLAAALSRLEARVLPTRGAARHSETPVVDLAARRQRTRRRALRAMGPALAASLLIVATLGTALVVVPASSPIGRRLHSWLGRSVKEISVAGLTDPQDIAAFDSAIDNLRRGAFVEAEAGFREVLHHEPSCVEARNNLAAALVEEHRLEAAAEQLREALALRPDYSRARANLDHVEALLAAAGPSNPAPVLQRNAVSGGAGESPSATVAGDAPAASHSAPSHVAAPVAPPAVKGESPIVADAATGSKPATAKSKRRDRASKHHLNFDDEDEDFDSSFDLP